MVFPAFYHLPNQRSRKQIKIQHHNALLSRHRIWKTLLPDEHFYQRPFHHPQKIDIKNCHMENQEEKYNTIHSPDIPV